MSRITMSRTRMLAGSGAAVLMMLAMPAAQSVAAPEVAAPDDGVDVSTCLAPIADPAHSADVMQGWIDGCRHEQVVRAALLRIHL